jgi:anti-repressor protein
MNNSIARFSFGFSDVRVILIGGEPWLVAKDVCDVLGIKNVSDALDRLDQDEKQLTNTSKADIASNDSDGSVKPSAPDHNLLVISESGFYRLVMTSRKPQIKKFQKWVTSEVIPSIRKTGSYGKVQEQPQRQLAPQRDLIDYGQLIKSMPLLANDPILNALLAQRLAEQLSPGVESIDHPEQPLNITSIASNLGYSQKEIGSGAALGAFVKLRHKSLGTSQHGKYQVHVYLPSEVEKSVQEFFARSAKKLAAVK